MFQIFRRCVLRNAPYVVPYGTIDQRYVTIHCSFLR